MRVAVVVYVLLPKVTLTGPVVLATPSVVFPDASTNSRTPMPSISAVAGLPCNIGHNRQVN